MDLLPRQMLSKAGSKTLPQRVNIPATGILVVHLLLGDGFDFFLLS